MSDDKLVGDGYTMTCDRDIADLRAALAKSEATCAEMRTALQAADALAAYCAGEVPPTVKVERDESCPTLLHFEIEGGHSQLAAYRAARAKVPA